MARLATQQYVPIFVGSTFVDLKSYRDAVCASLNRLELIVRGMEFFGSKPGSPVEECLAVVRSCRVYIGIFGMRYGSIPEGYDKSMTHLEYEEAQRVGLPSLIYILDEERQPILPVNVETGDGAVKLALLKKELRRKHVVSLFTTEDDLGRRILADLPPALQEIGTKIDGAVPPTTATPDTRTLLRRFLKLPKRLAGTEVTISFTPKSEFGAADTDSVEALSLELGETVSNHVKIEEDPDAFYWVYAQGAQAEKLLDVQPGARVVAVARTVFGIQQEIEWGEDGSITKSKPEVGLLIKKVVEVKSPPSANSSASDGGATKTQGKTAG